MYTVFNYKTKKALKADFTEGIKIGVFQPSLLGETYHAQGHVGLEGPHFPAPHAWYAEAEVKDGVIISLK